MRAAVVGVGRVGSMLADDPLLAGDIFTHAEAYTKSELTDLVALCDTDRWRLDTAGTRWNIDALFTDAATMMAAAMPEIVSVCTPTPSHLEVVRALVAAKKPPRVILCEKPLTRTLADAEEMARIAARRGVTIATIYIPRFAQNIIALKAYIDSAHSVRFRRWPDGISAARFTMARTGSTCCGCSSVKRRGWKRSTRCARRAMTRHSTS